MLRKLPELSANAVPNTIETVPLFIRSCTHPTIVLWRSIWTDNLEEHSSWASITLWHFSQSKSPEKIMHNLALNKRKPFVLACLTAVFRKSLAIRRFGNLFKQRIEIANFLLGSRFSSIMTSVSIRSESGMIDLSNVKRIPNSPCAGSMFKSSGNPMRFRMGGDANPISRSFDARSTLANLECRANQSIITPAAVNTIGFSYKSKTFNDVCDEEDHTNHSAMY